jgi:hypothetical protein
MKRVYLAIALLLIFFCSPAWADLSWRTLNELNLEKEPLDVAASVDGQTVFILVPGEIIVYDLPNNKVEKRIPVEPGFDRLTYAPKIHAVVLVGRQSNLLKVIKLEEIYQLDLSGLPFQGPENASVTVAVFSDYQ